ncbi:MAG: hypothetical protein PUC06_09370 [Oscillospiraceae bacterium]|nr:hypothetical protein [Oscillospiraceae bacterium]
MNMKLKGNGLKAVLMGTCTMLAISMGLTALAAALLGGEILPVQAERGACWVIGALSAFLGALVCGRGAREMRLPLCLASAAAYLLLTFVLRGLLFREVASKPWVIPILTIAGSVLGAMVASGKTLGKRQKRIRTN